MVDTKHPLHTDRLSIESEDTHNPYMRSPASKRASSSQRTDLRKLSAWIKLMRALEEAKKLKEEE